MKNVGVTIAGAAAIAAVSSAATMMLGDGTEPRLVSFGCHVKAQTCTADFVLFKDGKITGERQVRYGFDGKMRDERNQEISGHIPGEITACVKAFSSGKFDQAASSIK